MLIRLSGEVDLSWSQQVRHAVLAALEDKPAVGVELSEVSYIDSSGIAALVEGFQSARARGSRFALVAVSDAVRAVLELARLDRVFLIVADPARRRGPERCRRSRARSQASAARASTRSAASATRRCCCRCAPPQRCSAGAKGNRSGSTAIMRQMREIGADALPIVALLSLVIGLMLGIQFIAALQEFGAQSEVVIAVAKSVTREFGALITAILVAGRSGSALAARIGSMTVSQEVDALAVMGIEPVRYLVAPALIAMLVMLPALTIFANAIAIFGAAVYCAPALNVTPTAYLLQTISLLAPGDLWQGLAKSVVFAVLITLIGVSTGFRSPAARKASAARRRVRSCCRSAGSSWRIWCFRFF